MPASENSENSMFEQLRLLADAVTMIGEDNAISVVDAVNRRLEGGLRASIIRVYWRGPSERGVIFNPVTYHASDQDLEIPQSFELTANNKGLFAWVFEHKKPVWVSDLQDHIKNQNPIPNRAQDDALIDKEYLELRYNSDNAIILPLIINDQVKGIFSIEGHASSNSYFQNYDAFLLVDRITKCIATILESAYYTQQQIVTRKFAVKRFLDNIRDYKIPEELFSTRAKKCFIAMPYGDNDARKLSEKTSRYLVEKHAIDAAAFEHNSENYMIDGIMEQIDSAHFCLLDISGLNANVMIELGIMISSKKKYYLFKKSTDTSEIPFDINQSPVYMYDINRNTDQIDIHLPAAQSSVQLEKILDKIVQIQTQQDDQFSSALDYIPEPEEE